MLKRLLIFSMIITIALTSCTAIKPSTPESTATPIAPSDISWDDLTIFSQGLIQSQQDALVNLSGASIYHLDLTIAEDPSQIEGVEDVLYTNREELALDEVLFRLFPTLLGGDMTVSVARVDDTEVTPTYDLNNTVMRIPLNPSLQPGNQVVLHIEFKVRVPTEAGSNYGIFVYDQGVLTLAHAYPMIAVYDDEGWNVEIPPEHADIVYTDASFYLVRIDAPADMVIVATGREFGRQESGRRQLLNVANGPARDFYLAASEKYSLISETLGEVTVNSYGLPGGSDHTDLALQTAVRAIQEFSTRYGPYPYTEFDVVPIPTYALGIEFPGITGINLDLYEPQGDIQGVTTSVYLESATAHEVGHQWFYNMVGNDQLDEPWLDESLTQYVTWQYYLDTYGTDGGQGFGDALDERWQRVEKANIPIGSPVRDYTGTEYSAIIYGRGAFFFETLAEQMGVESFDQFILDYAQTYAWDIATTEGLKALAEQHCGCDLTPLFEEWVYP